MKKIVALILVVALSIGLLNGCVAGKTAMLFVEDVESVSVKLIWAGFSSAAQKKGMKPILSGLTEEASLDYTAPQIWEQDIAKHNPAVMAVVGLSDSDTFSLFLNQQDVPVIAIDPIDLPAAHEHFCVYGATDIDLSRMAVQNIIGMQLPTEGRIRLLYNKGDTLVCNTFTTMLEAAGYCNLETTPLSGQATSETFLNNFTEDTVGIYNASDYDTETKNLSNMILAGVTATHIEAINNEQAAAILGRNEFQIGEQAARACANALCNKEVSVVNVDPILITKNGPDHNGVTYWLNLLR